MLTQSTRDVAERDQFSYWREVVCDKVVRADFVRLDGRRHLPGSGFSGELTTVAFDAVRVAQVTADAQRATRTPQAIRRGQEDNLQVSVVSSGTGLVRQGDREALVGPGDFVLYDSARPYEVAYSRRFRQVVLMLPRDMLSARCPRWDTVTATTISGADGIGALVGSFLLTLVDHGDRVAAPQLPQLASNVADLLVTSLASRLPDGAQRGVAPAAHMLRARAYLTEHLHDPDLSVRSAADAIGVSVRYLHALFAAEGMSVYRWLRRQRLRRAEQLLTDPATSDTPVTQIAHSLGFKHPSHFTRLFKEQYGQSPRDFRARAPGR